MKQSFLLEFPISEYERRLKRLTDEMSLNNTDAIILTSDENTYYFTGLDSIVRNSKISIPGVVVITKDKDMTLSTPKSEYETAKITSCVEDIRIYGANGYDTLVKAIVSILYEKKIINGKIGLELGNGQKISLNYYILKELFKELRNADVTDAADILWNVRKIKSPMEIERIKKACEINVSAIRQALMLVEEGTTENELYSNIIQKCFKLGAEKSLVYGVRAGEERYSQSNCPPSDRPIHKGDIILIDGGPVYRGYCSDIIREAVIGKPSSLQQEIFDVAREACYVGIDKIKPGVPVNEVYKNVDAFLKRSGFSDIIPYTNWLGHSIGVGVHEYPLIDINTCELIMPGMVFAIEPYLYMPGVGSLGIEQNVLVTENGCEILTDSDDRLIIL